MGGWTVLALIIAVYMAIAPVAVHRQNVGVNQLVSGQYLP